MDPQEAVSKLVQQIVTLAKPLKVILFGSAARGDMRPDSDIDVLIVVPEGTPNRKTARYLYTKINGVGMPFDLIVTTPGFLEKNKDNIGLIYRQILKEGREVYVA